MNGLARIGRAFETARERHSAALMPYFTLGYPDGETSIETVAAVAAYSDLLELGVPFSDPIADGPTIQRSTQRALEGGMSLRGCLDAVRQLRGRGVQTPALLMGYFNPILAYGMEQFAVDAAASGVDGVIVPDLPPEESAELEALVAAQGMAYIFFLAPTSNPQRIASVVERANGFIYLVSLTGVTGARTDIRAGLDRLTNSIRTSANVPVAVGFGISSPEQARQVGEFADGVIVGSALINTFDREGIEGARRFVEALRAGMRRQGEAGDGS